VSSGLVVLTTVSALVGLATPTDVDLVAVAPLQTTGELPPRWTQALQAAAERGLHKGRFRTHAIEGSCGDIACWAQQGAEASAKFVIVASVAESFKIYDLGARLVRVRDAKVVATAADTCEVCGLADVEERFEALTAILRDKLDASLELPPRLSIRTDPPGAVVWLDDVEIGRTPLEYEGVPGFHRLSIQQRGYVPVERDLTLVGGIDEVLELDLVRQTGATKGAHDRGTRRSTRPWIVGGWTAVGVGLAGIAGGAALWAIDSTPAQSRCAGVDVDAFGNCRYLHDTLTGGIALVATGAAIGIVGAVLLGIGYKRRANVALGPRSATLEVRF
jgi:hypothetical protein